MEADEEICQHARIINETMKQYQEAKKRGREAVKAEMSARKKADKAEVEIAKQEAIIGFFKEQMALEDGCGSGSSGFDGDDTPDEDE